VEARINVVQTMIDKLTTRAQSNMLSSTKTMESLKSSVDYLSHFLITKNVDIQMKESQFEKDAERRNKDKPPTGVASKAPAQKTTK
jgi:hypothetical protein